METGKHGEELQRLRKCIRYTQTTCRFKHVKLRFDLHSMQIGKDNVGLILHAVEKGCSFAILKSAVSENCKT